MHTISESISFAPYYFKNQKFPVAEFLGKNTDGSLEIFLRNNFKEIYAGIPQTIINKRFPAFKEAVLSKFKNEIGVLLVNKWTLPKLSYR